MKLLVREVIDETLGALKASGTLTFEAIPPYNIEVPKNLEHGDWSCNVAMVMSKAAGKKPADIADAIIKGLVDRKSIVTSVEKAGPGFLNFRLRDAVFQAVAREVLEAGLTFGRSKQKSSGKKMQVEFVSANPTGPVHIGHARGAFEPVRAFVGGAWRAARRSRGAVAAQVARRRGGVVRHHEGGRGVCARGPHRARSAPGVHRTRL